MKKQILITALIIVFISVILRVSAFTNIFENISPATTSTYDIGSSTPSRIWNHLFVNFASTTALTVSGTASTTNLIISGTCTGCTSGLTSLNGLTGGTQTFSSNSLLTIVSSGTNHHFFASSSPGFGTLNASSTITFNALSNGIVNVSGGVLSSIANTTNGYVMALVGGVPNWVATSTISTLSGISWNSGEVLFADSISSLTGTTTANLKNTLKLNLVENTALTTWGGSANLTTLGTIGTGSWNATAITNAKGGTGQDSSLWTGFAGMAGGIWSASTTLSKNFIEDTYLFNTGDIGTGVYDFGGADSFEIVNGSNPTIDAAGELALDTTSGQLKWYDGIQSHIITGTSSPSFRIGSTTPDTTGAKFGSATTTFLIKNPPEPITLKNFFCKTDAGTLVVRFGDGTNWTLEASTTNSGINTLTTSNNTFTAFEDFKVQIGTASPNKPNELTCTLVINKTAD